MSKAGKEEELVEGIRHLLAEMEFTPQEWPMLSVHTPEGPVSGFLGDDLYVVLAHLWSLVVVEVPNEEEG
jgi:hypothetical protein